MSSTDVDRLTQLSLMMMLRLLVDIPNGYRPVRLDHYPASCDKVGAEV